MRFEGLVFLGLMCATAAQSGAVDGERDAAVVDAGAPPPPVSGCTPEEGEGAGVWPALGAEQDGKDAVALTGGGLLRGALVARGTRSVHVDEVQVPWRLAFDKAPARVTAPLALPPPWSGTLELVPHPSAKRTCTDATAVSFDDRLVRVELLDSHIDVNVDVFVKKGRDKKLVRHLALAHHGLVLQDGRVEVQRDAGEPPLTIFVGDDVTTAQTLDAARLAGYEDFLLALGDEVRAGVLASPAKSAQLLRFLRAANAMRGQRATVLPRARAELFVDTKPAALPEGLRPHLAFWQSFTTPGAPSAEHPKERTARLLIDDGLDEVWVDGREVFNRVKGTSSSLTVKVSAQGMRFSMVAPTESATRGAATEVHDTWAVLMPGEIYAVRRTFVAALKGGTRRECLRVEGTPPGGEELRWRELGPPAGPVLPPSETYRPSNSAAERSVGLVPLPTDPAPFPPMPLTYSYTHEGTYRWTVSADGTVRLDLLRDLSLCPSGVATP